MYLYLFTLQDLEEVDRVTVVAGVVLGHTRVHIRAINVVEDDAGGGVLPGVSNIILPVQKTRLVKVIFRIG